MTVIDVMEYAKYGELSQLAVGEQLNSEDPTTVINAERKLLSYINLGLIELYKRFNLKTDETTVTMVEGQTLYAVSASNFNSIYELYDELGNKYPLNEENNDNSIMTPSYNTIQIMNPSDGGIVYVIYNASPEKLVWAEDLSTLVVPIPPAMLEALLHYIGYRAHSAMHGEINAENNTHYMRFESSCARMLELGVVPTDDSLTSGEKLEQKGFI